MLSKLAHNMNPKRKRRGGLSRRRLLLEPLEARLLLAMMRDDVPSSAYEAYGQSLAYDPVVWVGRVDSTGAILAGGSGVVIDEHWLLISGHQVTDQTYTSLVFGTGTNLFTDPGETYAIADLITYPGYSGGWGGARDDIALAYSPSPIAITPAVRFTGTDEAGSHVSIVGYGTPGTTSGGLGVYDGEKRGGENIVDRIGHGIFGFGTNYFIADFAPLNLVPTPSLPLEFGVTPGDSGGGWFNDSGELVALSAFQYSDYKYSGGIRITQYNSWIDQTIASQDPLEVSISRDATQPPLTNDAPVLFTAVFSDQVTDFDAADVIATGAPGTLVPTVTPVGTGGMTYTIAVSGMTGDGQVVVSIPAGAAHNAGGNGNSASTALDAGVTYDVTPPGASVIDVLTNDETPVIFGTATDANDVATVTLAVAGQTFAAAPDADGNWSVEVPSALSDGANTVTVTVLDCAGNTSTDTATVTVDTVAPVVAAANVVTKDDTPQLAGTVTDVSPSTGITSVLVTVGGTQYPAAVSGTSWSLVLPTALADGTHTVTVTAADAAGNTSTDTATVTVDTVAPVVGVNSLTTTITAPTLTGPITDASPSSGITGVTVVVGGQTLAATVSGNTWSAVVSAPLAVGTYNVTATAVDAAGNTAADGTANELVVDTHPWHNSADPCNVDGRSGVEPVDVLLVINYINAHGSGPLPEPGPGGPPPYLDVNADDEVAPVDVLLVINWINSRTAGDVGEAEPWSDVMAGSQSASAPCPAGGRAAPETSALWPVSNRATSTTEGLPTGGDRVLEVGTIEPVSVLSEPVVADSWRSRVWDKSPADEWNGALVGLEDVLLDLVLDPVAGD